MKLTIRINSGIFSIILIIKKMLKDAMKSRQNNLRHNIQALNFKQVNKQRNNGLIINNSLLKITWKKRAISVSVACQGNPKNAEWVKPE